ncbi:hypothetical protein OESDEN_03767 [Oesophagostomum dentatum]|uniref:Uncharacterized protein n=1 Tax=Oesophagostomum dentatum TaxID=61180 RepID=A0A0B1TG97_OESDE|nr:hypothetical protein OESDEN_03767 [Oesophagostomum dentatum]
MRSILVILCFAALVSPWVIYRRNQKKRLICKTKSNSSKFIDDGDFDIVSDHLTPEEIKEVKQRIMDTCNALNSH